ncbi:ADAMTS3 [Mytilus edulis]|uniref:ADAMTS3 n=1 Tax=Mytilus edulis TaxID=6550 RepID=A0A8S3V7S1_MYTED|nr:ADAMTS3 [Mytilus edulis]
MNIKINIEEDGEFGNHLVNALLHVERELSHLRGNVITLFRKLMKRSWGCWQTAGPCSHSCGNGTRLKVRECNNPVPTNDESFCDGKNTTLEWCNLRECPVYKWGYLKDLNLTLAELKEIMKDEIIELKGNLTVDNKNTSSAIRRRISARDDRPSAASFGYFGLVMLAKPIVLMVCLDYNHLCPECIKRRIARILKKSVHQLKRRRDLHV